MVVHGIPNHLQLVQTSHTIIQYQKRHPDLHIGPQKWDFCHFGAKKALLGPKMADMQKVKKLPLADIWDLNFRHKVRGSRHFQTAEKVWNSEPISINTVKTIYFSMKGIMYMERTSLDDCY